MSDWTVLEEAMIQDGEGETISVKPGDKVQLLPACLYEHEDDDKDWEYFAQQNVARLQEWLGRGPFTIGFIRRWPCGRVMLYLGGFGKSKGSGVHADEFMSRRKQESPRTAPEPVSQLA